MKLPSLCLAASIALVACNQKPAGQEPGAGSSEATATQSAGTATPAPPIVDRGNVDFVDLPLDGSSNESHGVKAGESVSGEFAAPRAGNVVGVEVQVGNYGNSSAGKLKLKLCQAETCAEGDADLATSKDNEYFHIPLSEPLAIAADGKAVTYTLTRESGDNRMAVWSYPASTPESKLTLTDGTIVPRTLKLGLRFSR